MVTQDPLRCWFREKLCVCADCMYVNYDKCKFKSDAGEWVEKSMKQIPVKSIEPSDLEKIVEFYNKSGKLTTQHPTLIAIPDPNDDTKIVLFERQKKHLFMTILLIQAMSHLMLRKFFLFHCCYFDSC